MAGKAGKAGRPKRTEKVEGIFLRLRTDVMREVWSCKGAMEQQEGVSLSKAEAVERIFLAGCRALVPSQRPPAQTPLSEISEISSILISEISNISNGTPKVYDDMLACLGEEEDDETLALPVDAPQVSETPSATAETIGAQMPLVETPVHYGRPGISRETLQAIADERTLCEGLSIREFSQRLFDKDIYRAKAKDGRAIPVDHSRLRRWLEQAQKADLL